MEKLNHYQCQNLYKTLGDLLKTEKYSPAQKELINKKFLELIKELRRKKPRKSIVYRILELLIRLGIRIN
jgi:hypothetical protein